MAFFDPILFDLDGTLIDSSGDIVTAVNRTLDGLGLPELDDAEIVGFVGDGVRKLMQRTLAHSENTDVDAAVARFKRENRANCLERTKTYPGITDLLKRLAGRRLAVVTNKPADFASQILQGLGLLDSFDALVGGDEAALKPSPAPVELALSRIGGTATAGLMIGDHSNDVLAGQAAGLTTCGVLWGFDGGRALASCSPDHVCKTPRELESLLFS
jgi:phosphoglycolate phosphatase